MSFAIQLPTMASNKEQVGACVNMLSEKLPEGQERGLQALIFLGQYMEDWEGTKEEVRKSFSLIPPDFEITVHAPFTLTHLNPFFDLRDGRSICAVGQVADFVSDLGVKNITLHTGSTVMLKDWDGHYADPSVKSEERKGVITTLKNVFNSLKEFMTSNNSESKTSVSESQSGISITTVKTQESKKPNDIISELSSSKTIVSGASGTDLIELILLGKTK